MTNEQLAFLVTELTRGNPHYSTTYQEVMQRLEETIPSIAVIGTKEPFYVEKQTSSTKTTKGK